jgi:hypothetical protein
MNEIYNLRDYKNNINLLANNIKKIFSNNYEFIIIKNNSFLFEENEENEENKIMNFYKKLNNLLGEVKLVDKNKYSDANQDDYWVDVEYTPLMNSINILQPWKSNEQLILHTDNTLSNNLNFANITELVCIQPSDYSGETVIISNDKIIELVKYLDTKNNSNLYDNLINTKIYHKSLEKNICIKNNDTYTFNFNITQILKSELNTNDKLDIANHFSKILENIMKSSLVKIIKLEKGDALLFNDTLVMHGRKYVFGERLYKKCGILVN